MNQQDLDRLVGLLDCLPPPTLKEDYSREFWETFARTEHDRHEGAENYITGHLSGPLEAARKPDPHLSTVEYLAMYSLMFFDGERPQMWELLDHHLFNFPAATPRATGRRWAAEVCELAWLLYTAIQLPVWSAGPDARPVGTTDMAVGLGYTSTPRRRPDRPSVRLESHAGFLDTCRSGSQSSA